MPGTAACAPSCSRLQPSCGFETDLPSYACKRLALYLGKNASDIKLQKMAARQGNGSWDTFFDAAIDPQDAVGVSRRQRGLRQSALHVRRWR